MDFSETMVVCDIKVGRCSVLNESKSLRFNIFKFLFLNNYLID